MNTFSIDTSDDGATRVLRVTGDVDIASADKLIELGLLGLDMDSARTLAVDLADVTFLDSSGMGALVFLRNHALARGIDVVLRNVPNSVRRVLHIAGLDVVFSVQDHTQQSLTSPFAAD